MTIKQNPGLVDGLRFRVSHPKLSEPMPSDEELATAYQAAFRAPDHAWLRPWRFIECRHDERERLGEMFVEGLLADGTSLPEHKLEKIRKGPLRAPLVIVCYARIIDHVKVPRLEQEIATGCAANNLVSALYGLGYAAVWRSGHPAFSSGVRQRLNLDESSQIVGMLYVGSPVGDVKKVPELERADFVTTLSEQVDLT
ncbi:nitroreductase family protein [Reinekea blandensis]|uniref:Putative NAD(P)H nitroreductase n=1 Tax=Reinekea blandensis MED297 TaxID=314283 RepID=A4BGP0_9GAMM|nr:nitroreductase [Reinekea blandensis]EAR08688.1 nitroreductase family protein [Reinekea sp. MED297] [Reinekea blandensis MED297]